MVSRKTKRRKSKTHSYMATFQLSKFDNALRECLTAFGCEGEAAELVHKLCMSFASEFFRIATHFNDPIQMEEFYDACKRRSEDLASLNLWLLTDITMVDSAQVVRLSKDGLIQPFKGKWENRLTIIGEIDGEQEELWIQKNRRPGCYKHLLLADLLLIDWCTSVQEDHFLFEDCLATAQKLSTIVYSISKLYEDMRGNSRYTDYEEIKDFERLVADHQLDEQSEFYGTFLQVLDDIRNCSQLPYIRDIVNAIKSVDTTRKYSEKDYHISFRKTGTSYKGKTLPGLYAALVETDDTNINSQRAFDLYTGYTSHYNTEPTPHTLQYGGKTITIEQHKLSRRVIHMASNPRQDRLNYVHHIIQEILDHMQVDCTRDHKKGVQFAMNVTSPQYRQRFGNEVLSLDISKATDTIDMRFQVMCLKAIFPDEITDYWEEIFQIERIFHFSNSLDKVYAQTCGQPQGFKSSFPCFAWAHHIVMRIVMRHLGLERIQARFFYRVLGDDSIISTPGSDYNHIIRDTYIKVCSWINWDINLNKGYSASSYHPIALAEFAKKRILNGRINTAIPMKLILNAGWGIAGPLSLLAWISENYCPMTISQAWKCSEALQRLISELEIQRLEFLSSSGILPCFDSFRTDSHFHDYTDIERLMITLAYFLPKLRSTLIDQLLPDHIRDVGTYTPFKIPEDYFLGSKLEAELFDCPRDTDNKYYHVIQKNADLIDAINMILGTDVSVPEAIVALDLQPNEYDTIFKVLEIMEAVNYGNLPYDIHDAYESCHKAITILTRYNPRSDTRTCFLHAHFTTTVQEHYSELYSRFIVTMCESGQLNDTAIFRW